MTEEYMINARQDEIATERHTIIRRAMPEDLPRIVAIHQQAFSKFFLTRLGREFLHRYYSLVLEYRAGIVLVAECRRMLQGFVCGFIDPPAFYRLMWRKKQRFVLPAFSALVRHPALGVGVIYGIRRIQSSASMASAQSCELSSIAVSPEASGNGLGKGLLRAFVNQSRSMDALHVRLTTDAYGNESANTLYQQFGFQLNQQFVQRKGRWMNEYVISAYE